MATPNPIAELVGSRICHDLISPLGAIGNGVELLELSGMLSDSPEMQLIADSVRSANARVRFFRLAFGAAAPDTMIARSEVTQLLAASPNGGKISYFWAADGPRERREVRAVFLALMCLESALPQGGNIQIGATGADWTLRAEADRLLVNDALWEGLRQPRLAPQLSPAQVQFALLPSVLAEMDRAVAVKIGADHIEITF
jgi:histidine phosphotransferase ChpT